MYSTGPATVALTEFEGTGLNTTHHKDKRALVQALLRHRDYFALITEEYEEAKKIWEDEKMVEATILNRFPGIKAAAIMMAYDNGMINRHTFSENEWLFKQNAVLGAEGVYEEDLKILDAWCQTLSEEELQTLVAGEEEEMKALEQKCPKPELCKLFNEIASTGV